MRSLAASIAGLELLHPIVVDGNGTARCRRTPDRRCRAAWLLSNQSTLLTARAGAHSEKPEAFYRLVSRRCPGSTLELFARRKRHGFALHGNAVSKIA
jgi:N6-adenosine-specific RNA methylase IME4